MPFCSRCGRELLSVAIFCDACGVSVTAPEFDQMRFEYEALTTRVYTRETSTLTIATLTTAAALAFLAIIAQRQVSEMRVYLVLGLLFTLAGIFYREVTLFTIDRKQLLSLRQIERDSRIFPNGIPTYHGFWTYFRWFIFRCVMFSPVLGFLYLGLGGENVLAFALLGVLVALVPLLLAVAEYLSFFYFSV